MRNGSSPQQLRSDLRSRRFSVGLLAATCGMVLFGVFPLQPTPEPCG